MDDRQHAHDLLDRLAPAQLAAVTNLLETMVSNEDEDDTLSEAERKAIAEADEWLQRNQLIPHEKVLAEFGLSEDDLLTQCAATRPDKTLREVFESVKGLADDVDFSRSSSS
jgi:hypothetical protein